MKAKNWLIHKLGGITLEDAYRERCNLIQYKQSNVVTCINSIQLFKNVPAEESWLKTKLAQNFLETIEDNMEIECVDIPEKGMIEYRGILRMVKVE